MSLCKTHNIEMRPIIGNSDFLTCDECEREIIKRFLASMDMKGFEEHLKSLGDLEWKDNHWEALIQALSWSSK